MKLLILFVLFALGGIALSTGLWGGHGWLV